MNFDGVTTAVVLSSCDAASTFYQKCSLTFQTLNMMSPNYHQDNIFHSKALSQTDVII